MVAVCEFLASALKFSGLCRCGELSLKHRVRKTRADSMTANPSVIQWPLKGKFLRWFSNYLNHGKVRCCSLGENTKIKGRNNAHISTRCNARGCVPITSWSLITAKWGWHFSNDQLASVAVRGCVGMFWSINTRSRGVKPQTFVISRI